MAESSDIIKCTILTLRSKNVMLPSSSIAEIISVNDPSALKDAPNWYLGKMDWRGVELPLVSFEAVEDSDVKSLNLNTQVAVMFAPNAESAFPYIGLIVSGVPHVTRFSRDQITVDEDVVEGEELHPMVAYKARINGAAVSILDLDNIESMINEADSSLLSN